MKIIPKHQKGGSFDAFFTTYVPVGGSAQESRSSSGTSRGSRSSSSDSTKGQLTEKDFYDMIKDIDGLPNEMSSVISNLVDLTKLQNLTGIDVGDLSTSYLQNLLQLKVIEQNKEKYDEVMKQASESGSLVEPAIATNGDLLFQKDDGSIGTVDVETFNKNRDKYKDRLLTVSNLAYMRKFDPKLAYNQSIFDIIDNSMGYEEFQKLLSDAAQSLGTSESSREGLFSVQNQALQGYKVLQSLSQNDQVQAMDSVSLEGLYNYKLIDSNQQQQISNLLSYIVSAFPDRAKTWASIKTGISDKNKALEQLSLAYLLGKQTTKHQFGVDYLGGIEKVQGKTSSSSDGADSRMTYLTAVQNGYGGGRETRTINLGNNTNFNVTGTAYGSFLGQDKKTVSNVNLQDLLSQTGIAAITNPNSITFGDNILNSSSLSQVVIKNNGGFWAVLPCKRINNQVTPDFDLIDQFSKVVDEVINQTTNSTSPEEKQRLLEQKLQQKPELQSLLDMSGHLDSSRVSPFFIVDGLASENSFNFTNPDGSSISDKPNPLISVTDNQSDIKYFQEVSKDKDFDAYDSLLGDAFGFYDNLYSSKVFIPIQNNNRLSAIIFSGQQINDSKALQIEEEYQNFQNYSKMNNSSSKYLYQ